MPASQMTGRNRLRRLLDIVSKQAFPGLSETEITRHIVRSKSIATLGHDATRKCLQVEYFNGILYRIDDVSVETYQNLKDAEDFDRIFQQEICAHLPMKRIGCVAPVHG